MDEEEIMRAWGLEDETPDEELDEGGDLDDLEETDELDDDQEEESEEDAEDPEDTDEAEEDAEDPLQAERERIAEQSRREVAAAVDAQIEAMGAVDPYNGNKPIKTKAEYDAYLAAHANAKFDNMANQLRMSRKELDALIGQHPDVVAGRRLKAQLEQQNAANARKQAERELAVQIAQIGRLCPGVDSREAILNHESWPRVQKLMEENVNLGLKDAFRLANADTIEANAGKRAKAAAKRNAAGKQHLRGSGGRGEGLGEVPPEVKAIYRAWEPGITEAEMRKAYAADMKNK